LTITNLFLKEITMDSKTIKIIVASVAGTLVTLAVVLMLIGTTGNKTTGVKEDRDRQQIRKQFGF
jgi:hypothetical protein